MERTHFDQEKTPMLRAVNRESVKRQQPFTFLEFLPTLPLMKAAILAIGTELTSGQITNKNATWISHHLSRFGIEVTAHIAVPDNRELILKSLQELQKNEFIFLTGGLGPTSDDFTRDVVSDFTESNMHFDTESWTMLSERLTSRGYTVKEIQKQQCYFPENSKILKNKQGTANGFWLTYNETDYFVLPGPPKEVEACWYAGVEDRLLERTKHLDPLVTYHWDTMGLGESDLALLVEEVTRQIPNKTALDIGFRVHLPYVEFKITLKKSLVSSYQKYFDQLGELLKPHLISTTGEDQAQLLISKLKQFNSISVFDEVSDGFLPQRITGLFKQLKHFSFWSFSKSPLDNNESELELGLLFRGENRAEVYLRKKKQVLKLEVVTPYHKVLMAERRRQYFAELAVIQWNKWLS